MKQWSLDDDRINELEKEVRNLQRKVKRRDNKIIELEKKIKNYEKLLYKLGLRPLTIEFRSDVQKE